MADPLTATETSDAKPKRRWIRGLVYGFFFGLGLSVLLISYAKIALGTLTPFVVLILGTFTGLAVSLLAPPKKPKAAGDEDGDDTPSAPVSASDAGVAGAARETVMHEDPPDGPPTGPPTGPPSAD